MHLVLSNVTKGLWELFSGDFGVMGIKPEPYIMSKGAGTTIGREIANGRATVPLTQARALRDIQLHWKSYMASDWLFFLRSVGEVILCSRIPDEILMTFMHLCQAARLMFRTSGLSEEELRTVERHLKNFCRDFYKYINAERPERVRVCLPVVAALFDVVPNMRACCPAWSYWQFPIERLIGTLPDLVRSNSEPYAALTNAIVHKYNKELITRYAQTYAKQKWADATGKPVAAVREVPTGAYKLSEAPYPPVYLLPPRHDPAHLTGLELERMREVLSLEGIEAVPNQALAKKYFALKLARGQVAGTTKQASRRNYRRNHLV